MSILTRVQLSRCLAGGFLALYIAFAYQREGHPHRNDVRQMRGFADCFQDADHRCGLLPRYADVHGRALTEIFMLVDYFRKCSMAYPRKGQHPNV
jgi:hypothetical protein